MLALEILLSIVAQVREEFEETGAASAKTTPTNTAAKTEWILAILKKKGSTLSVLMQVGWRKNGRCLVNGPVRASVELDRRLLIHIIYHLSF